MLGFTGGHISFLLHKHITGNTLFQSHTSESLPTISHTFTPQTCVLSVSLKRLDFSDFYIRNNKENLLLNIGTAPEWTVGVDES